MDKEERSWAIWQPPVMLVKPARFLKLSSLQTPALQSFQLRNLFNVPAVTRATAHGTSLSKQLFHYCSNLIKKPWSYAITSTSMTLVSCPVHHGVAHTVPTLL